jgi:leucyl-tRNA synthetase
VHRLFRDEDTPGDPVRSLVPGAGSEEQARLTARTIAGVTEDLENMQPNTAIAKLMVWSREIVRGDEPLPRESAEAFLRMLSPFAPHLAEELWHAIGHPRSLAHEAWPEADPALLTADTIRIAVQVNGKRRDEIEVPAEADEETIRAAALAAEGVQRHTAGREPRRIIVVPGRLVNIVV